MAETMIIIGTYIGVVLIIVGFSIYHNLMWQKLLPLALFVTTMFLVRYFNHPILVMEYSLFAACSVMIGAYDVKTHTISLLLLGLMILSALVFHVVDWKEVLLAVPWVTIPFIPFALMKKGLGMGDILLMIPMAMTLGVSEVYASVIVGLTVFLAVYFTYLQKKEIEVIAYPMAPWLGLGAVLMCLI